MDQLASEKEQMKAQLSRIWLWAGILLFAFGIGGFYLSDTQDITQPMDEMFAILPMPILIGYVVFVGPILEELAFRSWTIGKTWAKIVGLVLMALYAFGTTQKYVLMSIVLMILAIAMFYKSIPSHIRLLILMIGTSFLFGFIHITNVVNWQSQLSYTIYAGGIGMVLSYVALKFKFIYAVLIHIVFNGIVTFINKDELDAPKKASLNYQSDVITVEANKEVFGVLKNGSAGYFENVDGRLDSVHLTSSSLDELMEKLYVSAYPEGDLLYKPNNGLSAPHFTGKLVFLKNDDAKMLIQELEKGLDLETEIEEMPKYELDMSNITVKDEEEALANLGNLIDLINGYTSGFIIKNESSYDTVRITNKPFENIRKIRTLEEAEALLSSLNIKLRPTGQQKVVKIL